MIFHRFRKSGLILLLLFLAEAPATVLAQWLRYPSPGLPRTSNGEPNLTAPTPRLSTGKPDLSGLWRSVLAEKRDADPDPAFMNLENYLVAGSSIVMLPSSEALFRERRRIQSAGRPSERCLPHSIPDAMLIPAAPFKIVQTPGLTLILYEEFARFRQVFSDGRLFPADLNPAWLGSSIGVDSARCRSRSRRAMRRQASRGDTGAGRPRSTPPRHPS